MLIAICPDYPADSDVIDQIPIRCFFGGVFFFFFFLKPHFQIIPFRRSKAALETCFVSPSLQKSLSRRERNLIPNREHRAPRRGRPAPDTVVHNIEGSGGSPLQNSSRMPFQQVQSIWIPVQKGLVQAGRQGSGGLAHR